jgi:tripartite-type tricarboxylate transporter receptor subunit TctC
MNISRRPLLRLALASLIWTGVAAANVDAAGVDSYPDHPIRLIVPYSAGSGSDAYARLLSQKLGTLLGQPFVVENRDGAGGIIAAKMVAQSAPDGYTIMLAGTPWAVTPYLYSKGEYDPLRDFSLIGQIGFIPSMLVVPAGSSINTLQDLIEQAKRAPGQLTYASSGIGSPSSLSVEYLASMAHIQLREIPYKSTAQALQDTIAGQVSMNLPILTTALPNVAAGRLKAIGVTSAQRVPTAPQVPTIAEAGIPGYEASVWIGLEAAAHTPAPIVARLNRALNEALAAPETIDQFARLGVQVSPTTPERFAAYVKTDTEKWAALVKQLGLRLQ